MIILFLLRHFRSSIRIRPRVLINVEKRDTSCELFGLKLDLPIAIAPTAMQKMAYPDGERATAKGICPISICDTCMYLKSLASDSISCWKNKYDLYDEHIIDEFH